MSKVQIYDTTLRDGAQAEGISFSLEDKLMIAKELDGLGVAYIEGGWPNPTNPKDLAFFERVKGLSLNAKVVAFGSTRRAKNRPEDDPILRTLLEADTEVIALFGKSWDLHVTTVLKATLDENLELIKDSVAYLKSKGREVVYDAEHYFDGYKENSEYALKTLEAAARGGADVLVLCDTNGGCLTSEVQKILQETLKQINLSWGVHMHNDSGMAVANTIVGVQLGATQVQGTINGYGERCGNANLCSIIPTLQLKLSMDCIGDKLSKLMEVSRFVSEVANIGHDHRQPYVGESAFAHKGGAHIDGVVKEHRTFEHVEPGRVGNERRFLVSDQAGGAVIVAKLQKLYPDLQKKDPFVREVLERVKKLEHEGYQFEAADASFELLACEMKGDYKESFHTQSFRVVVRQDEDGRLFSEAIVEISVNGDNEHTVARGDGPVNALDAALRKALHRFYPQISRVHLEDYKVRVLSSSEGTAAKVRVLIESSDGTDVWGTVGVSENVIEASWIALVHSLNYKLLKEGAREGS